MPEGLYSICAEVYDYFSASNIQVSNTACAYAWFNLQEPPLLNYPACGTTLSTTSPQNITFSWSPLSMSSSMAMLNTEYELQLFEVRPNGNEPNIVVNTTLPIFITTTTTTFYNYGIVDPPLQTGMQYVWRVRAYDVTGRENYKNNGYSQVCTFTYGNLGEAVAGDITLNLTANGLGPRLAQANWNASSSFTNYQLEVRKKGGDYEWFTYSSSDGNVKLTSLEPETEYECRVKGFAGTYASEYSNTASFITAALPNYTCNSTIMPPIETSAPPLAALTIGNIINAGQFEVVVTHVLPSAPGLFSGMGKVRVNFTMLNFNVEFRNITIDENMNLKAGRIDVVTRPVEQWESEMTDDTYNYAEPDYYVQGDVDSVSYDGDNIVLFTENGPITINYPGGEYVVEDENGDQWIFYPDGTYSYYPGVPHVELTAEEKMIFKEAIKDLKNSYTSSDLESKKENYTNAKNQLNSSLTTSGINYIEVNESASKNGILMDEIIENEDTENTDEYLNFETSRRSYYSSKLMRSVLKTQLSSSEYDYFANEVLINEQKAYFYIRNHISDTETTVLINLVKTGIIEMIEKRVNNHY